MAKRNMDSYEGKNKADMYDRPGQMEKGNVPFKGSTKDKDRHNEFQRGHNPMAMSPFEMDLVRREKLERMNARDKYVMGIQGRDGGKCYEAGDDIVSDKRMFNKDKQHFDPVNGEYNRTNNVYFDKDIGQDG
jgi:hypothetical protein